MVGMREKSTDSSHRQLVTQKVSTQLKRRKVLGQLPDCKDTHINEVTDVLGHYYYWDKLQNSHSKYAANIINIAAI